MAKTSTTPGKGLAYAIREEDLEELNKLRMQLHDTADQFYKDGRIFMTETYIMLIAQIDPMITRIEKRFKREALAGLRHEVKDLKADQRAKANTEGSET